MDTKSLWLSSNCCFSLGVDRASIWKKFNYYYNSVTLRGDKEKPNAITVLKLYAKKLNMFSAERVKQKKKKTIQYEREGRRKLQLPNTVVNNRDWNNVYNIIISSNSNRHEYCRLEENERRARSIKLIFEKTISIYKRFNTTTITASWWYTNTNRGLMDVCVPIEINYTRGQTAVSIIIRNHERHIQLYTSADNAVVLPHWRTTDPSSHWLRARRSITKMISCGVTFFYSLPPPFPYSSRRSFGLYKSPSHTHTRLLLFTVWKFKIVPGSLVTLLL